MDYTTLECTAGSLKNLFAIMSNDQLIEQGIIIGGDPDSVCRGIERWQNAGVDTLLLMLGAGNTTHEQVMRGLDILGAKVIPTFKEAAI